MFGTPTVELYFGKGSGTKEMFDLIKRSKFSVLVIFFFYNCGSFLTQKLGKLI